MIPTRILTNKWLFIAIGVIIAILVLRRHGKRWWTQATRTDRGNYAGQEAVRNNPARQAELDQMARDAQTAMHTVLIVGGTTWTGREAVLERLLALNDTELRYVAQFYRSINESGNSLRVDVQGEWMPFTNVDERLVARLNQLAL